MFSLNLIIRASYTHRFYGKYALYKANNKCTSATEKKMLLKPLRFKTTAPLRALFVGPKFSIFFYIQCPSNKKPSLALSESCLLDSHKSSKFRNFNLTDPCVSLHNGLLCHCFSQVFVWLNCSKSTTRRSIYAWSRLLIKMVNVGGVCRTRKFGQILDNQGETKSVTHYFTS